MTPRHDTPPVILLGGAANALSVARSLGRRSIPVHALLDPGALVKHSRFCRPLDVPPHAWSDFLLGPDSDSLRGAVLLTCGDAGIELLCARREALAQRFLLDDSAPPAALRMLNKLDTYEAARAAGVPTPPFRVASGSDDLDRVLDGLAFPLIVKPRLSHVFERRTGLKLFIVHDPDALRRALLAVDETGTESLLVERIPGPDSLLCSYFTYLDEASRPLFHFTKRIVRRYPALMGTACSHVTDHVPHAADLGNRLFAHVGLRGLANVEFKLDPRDNRLKLIECNARFTASNALVARAGIDLALFTYNRITGRPSPPTDRFTVGLRMWDPIRDFQSYRELAARGELTFPAWLRSVVRPQSTPYFEWTDPLPALARLARPFQNALSRPARTEAAPCPTS